MCIRQAVRVFAIALALTIAGMFAGDTQVLAQTEASVRVETGSISENFQYIGISGADRPSMPFQVEYWNTGAKEIFGDAVWMTRSQVAPVIFVVKDASQNPVCNMTVRTYRRVGGTRTLLETLPVGNISFDQFYLFGGYSTAEFGAPTPTVGDTVLLEWEATYNDNVCFSSHVSRYFNRITFGQPLPSIPNWYRVDTHYHTRFTDNGFEFGGFMWMLRYASEVIGLQAVCLTDHSTDIRTSANEFGWNQLLAEADSLSDELVLLIPGEELTVDSNESNEFPDNRIHLLAYGLTRPLLAPEECCSQNASTQLWTLRQGLDSISVQNGVALAAHPSANFSVGYGGELTTWSATNFDIASTFPAFLGSEFYNERKTVMNNPVENDDHVYDYDWTPDPNWERSWYLGLRDFMSLVQRNLNPVRPFVLAGGSDGHGDFGRKYTNQYGITGRVTNDNALGKVHTLVYSPSGLNQTGILAGMRSRAMTMSDGPALAVSVDVDGNGTYEGTVGGQYAFGPNAKLRLEGGSLAGEHGTFTQARVYRITSTLIDSTIVSLSGTTLNQVVAATSPVPGSWSALIVNVRTQKGYQATTSPIYVAPQGVTNVGGQTLQTWVSAPTPNPTSGPVSFTLELKESDAVGIEVYDVRGRLIWHSGPSFLPAGQYQMRWDLRDQSTHPAVAGIYFVRVVGTMWQSVQRVVVIE